MATRVQFGTPDPEETRYTPDQFKGSARVTVNGDQQTFEDLSNRSSDTSPVEAGILSTAKTPYGTRATELNDKTVVKAGGMEMTLKQAADLGFVRKTANGYEEIGSDLKKVDESEPGESEQGEQNSGESDPDTLPPLDDDAGTIETFLDTKLTPAGTETFANKLLTNPENAVDEYASRLGMEPSEVKSMAEMLYAKYYGQAVAHISKRHGIDGAKVLKWAESNVHPDNLREVQQLHFYQAVHAFDEIVNLYKKHSK